MTAPAPGAVEVWSLAADEGASAAVDLPAAELRRAERFRDAGAQRRFLAGRRALRSVLAGYLETTPMQVALTADSDGKPYVNGRFKLSFNMAHSGERIVLAVANGVAVGIDIERIAPSPCDEAVVRSFFSGEERRDFSALPRVVRAQTFFRVWVCKEALAKALGGATAMPFDRFAVRVPLEGSPRLVRVSGDDTRHWSLIELAPWPGYAAALAVRAPAASIRYRKDFPPQGRP